MNEQDLSRHGARRGNGKSDAITGGMIVGMTVYPAAGLSPKHGSRPRDETERDGDSAVPLGRFPRFGKCRPPNAIALLPPKSHIQSIGYDLKISTRLFQLWRGRRILPAIKWQLIASASDLKTLGFAIL
jgi:hypothetical protein